MPKTIPYGIGNYAELVERNAYFVDKTAYVARLEAIRNPVFLRPATFWQVLVLLHFALLL